MLTRVHTLSRGRWLRAPSSFVLPTVLVLASCSSQDKQPVQTPKPVASHTPANVELGRPEGAKLLAREAAAAVQNGALPLQVFASEFVAEGDRIGSFISMPSDDCLLVYARGSESVEDIDLIAFSEEGAILAGDENPDARPTLIMCPPQPKRAFFSARVSSGRGLLAVGMHTVPRAASSAVASVLGAKGLASDAPGKIEGWPGLDAKVRQHRKDLGAKWEETRRSAIPVDPRAPTTVSANLEAGRCLSVLVTPNDEVSNLEVALLDGNGRAVTRASERERDRTALVCSSINTTIAVEIRPRVGSGIAAVVLSRTVAGSEPELNSRVDRVDLSPSIDLATARTNLANRLRPIGLERPSAQGTANAEVGRRVTQEVSVAQGCSRVDVIGGQPVAGLLADLWKEQGDTGTLQAHAEGSGIATLFTCGAAEKLRLDVESTLRPGPIAWEVRTDSKAPAELTKAGVAAGRLLDRLSSQGRVVSSSSLEKIHTFTLDSTTLKTVTYNVGAGKCIDIAAATDRGGSRVELRLKETPAPDVPNASQGQYSALVTACAPPGVARNFETEIRLLTGQSTVLVAGKTIDLRVGLGL